MKVKNFFGSYKTSNADLLAKYISDLGDSVDKVREYGYPFIDGNYNYNFKTFLESKNLNYDSLTPKETFDYLSQYFENVVDYNNPGTMINVIPSVNLVSLASAAYAEMYNQNFAQDTYSGNLILTELEVSKYMSDLIGWDWTKSFGFFTFGGTGTNLYGNKLMLVNADPDSRTKGTEKGKYFMLTSKNGHPCHYQLCDWLGIGSEACIEVACDKNGKIDVRLCEKIIDENIAKGKIFLGFNLNGGSTNEMYIDPVKKIYDLNKKIIKKYNLSYKPHIHVDSVLGWLYLVFENYDFDKNDLNMDSETLNIIKYLYEQIKDVKYATTIGVDFHKTGFCPYVTSMVLVKDYKTFYKLNPEKEMKIDDINYGNYNPYLTSLEYSRSCHGPVAALTNLKSLGIKGLQQLCANITSSAHYFRKKLSENPNVVLIAGNTLGNATMFLVKPKFLKDFNEKGLYSFSEDDISKLREFNVNFGKYILNKSINKDITFFFTSSRSYTLPASNIKAGTLKAYPMSVFLDKNEVDRIVEELNKEISNYVDNEYDNNHGKEFFQDMSKDSKEEK